MLSPDAAEAERGFLLNHVISEWLPAQTGPRLANADPITGQAAWYDLRVNIKKCAKGEEGITAPHPSALTPPPNMPEPPKILRFNAGEQKP
jgi:hypothetical protein